MPELTQSHEIAALIAQLPDCLISELMATEPKDSGFEMRLGFLRNLNLKPQFDQSHAREGDIKDGVEIRTPAPMLPPGPWRSLGGCFDYSGWPDRDRFLELDGALASAQYPEPKDEPNGEVSKWIEHELLRT